MAERKSYLLRLPPDLWDDLQRLAGADLRSINAEIEFLLRESVKQRMGGSRRHQSPPEEAEGDDA